MDVDRSTFAAMLPSMLKHVSNAHFIAFDLELSGIPTQRRRDADGKQTIAERYRELKAAAETYHILQVGLTCVEEDAISQKYVMRSFNFNLSPLIYEGVEFERNFTYSSSAVDFLLQHNYQMNAPFASGIPHLTRSEAETAKEQTRMRWDRDAIPDINVRPDNIEAINFMRGVRKEIDDWRKLPKSLKADMISISAQAPADAVESDLVYPLNRFEKRLIHQIVRADYPDLQTFGRTSTVQVEKKSKRNIEDEKYQKESLQRRLNRAVSTQVGFRWLAEAMAGEHGNFSGMDASMCSRDIEGEETAETYDAFIERMDSLRGSLKQRKSILVGHNCFLDLIYIYKNFYGPLPDSVEEFQVALHKLFPIIIDTKFMATDGPSGYAFRSSQLWQIQEAVANEPKPIIESASEHPQYKESESYHQAGFDSFVTAKVFLKLATRLEAEGRYETTIDEAQRRSNGDTSASVDIILKENTPIPVKDEPGESNVSQGIEPKSGKKNKKSKNKGKATPSNEPSDGKYFSSNIYDSLLNLPSDTIPSDIAELPTSSSNAIPPESTSITSDMTALNLNVTRPRNKSEHNNDDLIPPWTSDFWRVYGNKLRAYGTVEEVCDLTAKPVVAASEDESVETAKEEDGGGGVKLGVDAEGRRNSLWEVVKSYIPS